MAEAKLNREYAVRIAGVGALMCGICVWSLIDGMVAWPQCNRNMDRVRPALLATPLTAEAWLATEEDGPSRLDAAFAAQGVGAPSKLVRKIGELRIPDSTLDRDGARAAQLEQVRKAFEMPVYSNHDLQTQFVQAAVTLLLGVCAFLSVGLKARRRIRADETGVSGLGARSVAYGDIQSIDWTKWDEKGIVKLTLRDGSRATLDGWHFAGVTGIVDELIKHRPDLAPKAPRKAP